MSQNQSAPRQEFNDAGTHHRLVAADGRVTPWASYQQIALLDGFVGCTAYYAANEQVCTPEEFVSLIAVQA